MDEQGDLERMSRLQVLQMEDLGLERRDYLSTRDDQTKHVVSLHRLEASRASNQEGTRSHQLAEQNKEKLNAWKDAWKTFGDDAQGDDLTPLLDGQSHRYNLMQTIKAHGGQKYETEPDTSVHPRGRRALGAPGGTGRGGGVIGSRGRQQSASQKSNSPAGYRGRSRIAANALSISGRPRDPARDSNNPQSPPSRRGPRGRAHGRRPSTIRQRIPIMAPPPPNPKYDAMLADSASFMAALSNLRPLQAPSKSATSPGKQDHNSINEYGRLSPYSTSSHDESSDDVGSEEALETAVDMEEGEIVDEMQNVQKVEESTVAAPASADVTSEQPILGAIEVFGSPSAESENQTDSLKPKVGRGFKSSLPQPGAFTSRRKPAFIPNLIDYDDDNDGDNDETGSTASSGSSTVVQGPIFSNAPQAPIGNITSNELTGKAERPAISQSENPESAEDSSEPQNEVNSARKELLELEQTLSGPMTLPDSVRKFLQNRKKELEDLIYLKATRPLVTPMGIQAPNTQAPKTQAPNIQAPNIQAPKMKAPNTQALKTQDPKEVAEQPRATDIPAMASQTRDAPVNMGISRESRAHAVITRPRVDEMFPLDRQSRRGSIAQKSDVVRAFEALDTLPDDEENIIGNHLLPGRNGKPETKLLPVSFGLSQKENVLRRMNVPSVRPTMRGMGNNPIPTAVSSTESAKPPSQPSHTIAPSAPASQPSYGSQLKMRETPYLPQTAAAKQYVGQASENSSPGTAPIAPTSQPSYGTQLKMRETPYLPQTAAAKQYAGQPLEISAPEVAPIAPTSQPSYGTQLKMRETPYLPQTAAAKQYAGQPSENNSPRAAPSYPTTQQQGPSRLPRQSVNAAGYDAISPPSSGRTVNRDRGRNRFDSRGSVSGRSPPVGSFQPYDNVNMASRGQENFTSSFSRIANDLFGPQNDPFVTRRAAGNDNQELTDDKPPAGSLASSKWASAPETQTKVEDSRKTTSSGLESSIWASRGDSTRGNDLSASRWAH